MKTGMLTGVLTFWTTIPPLTMTYPVPRLAGRFPKTKGYVSFFYSSKIVNFPSKQKSERQKISFSIEKHIYFRAERPLQTKSNFVLWPRYLWRRKRS